MPVNLICIGCPKGCNLMVQQQDSQLTISGQCCLKGEEYARQEILYPLRIVTSTVKITHAIHSQLPVVTSQPVLKNEIKTVMAALRGIEVKAPVVVGQVIVSQGDKLPCDFIATRSMEKIS